jgi:hypothetical protein
MVVLADRSARTHRSRTHKHQNRGYFGIWPINGNNIADDCLQIFKLIIIE